MDVPGFEEKVREEYGNHADAFLAAANVHTPEALLMLYRSRDFHIFYHAYMAFARLMHEQNRTVYAYTFEHDVPGDDGAGSYHGSDLWFFFDSLNRCWRPFTGKHYDLARAVSSYLVNFVATGDPNGADCGGAPLPLWEPLRGGSFDGDVLPRPARAGGARAGGWRAEPAHREAAPQAGLTSHRCFCEPSRPCAAAVPFAFVAPCLTECGLYSMHEI